MSEHGTYSRYVNQRCRCEPCREASRAYRRSKQGQEPPQHGYSAYYNYGCRCQVCRDGNTVRNRINEYAAQKAWRKRVQANPTPSHVHGTTNGYNNYGCRCDLCREANLARMRRRRTQAQVSA